MLADPFRTHYSVHMFTLVRQLLISGFVAVLALGGTVNLATAQDTAGFRLLLIEQAGCYYCRVFNRDIAHIYEQSAEGRAAPLIRADLRGPVPDGVTLTMAPFVTPTFILIGPDGQEVERLTGYPGDHFFWAYVNDMLTQAGALAPDG